ncbi:class I SAM-dependent methyltransferase [Mycobacterium sp. SMC-4]|uniref:class I SAM-dependent methyltransferase n=1 Tax=Mycobacterium sp. SMC-4 TaxID=2857059 RepID=UPI0021B302BD|nr:class I SAM-dependent methyltransferase [Mycobacterium sp. SMC-4]UXA16066.1 class I SAM-dependent methyltransferase [Mycobacterium sp. SMC-4]
MSTQFSDREFLSAYEGQQPRRVPGYHAMHRMAAVLIAEHAPHDAQVLVLGAGGGLEIKAFAEANPGWSFDGVDPSADMLELAEHTLGPLADRARLTCGLIDDAPSGPFDAAASILTLQFLDPGERSRTVAEVRRRLKPGAPFVVAHFGFPHQNLEDRSHWLSRYVEFAVASGVAREDAEAARLAIDEHLHILTPDEDQAILRDAGFTNITEFYTALTFRGWVCYVDESD